ncbi:hypothetical protein AIZ04_25545, partial [Salmonella enterica subsp. enterica serovar Typhimurium]
IIEKLIENDIAQTMPTLNVRSTKQHEQTKNYSNTADAKKADKRVKQKNHCRQYREPMGYRSVNGDTAMRTND